MEAINDYSLDLDTVQDKEAAGVTCSTDKQTRQKLASRLLDAVKQCQIRFGGRTELATDSDGSVACLCAQFESVLQHGLRMRRCQSLPSTITSSLSSSSSVPFKGGSSALLHGCRDVMTTLNLNFKTSDSEPVFWEFVLEFLTRHEQERYILLKNISSDAGRGRAWLRSSLNEHSLERYMNIFLADPSLLCRFYEETSFMRDQEKSSLLPNMAAGLGSILFAINIDNADLNMMRAVATNPPSLSSVTSQSSSDEPGPIIANPSLEMKEKRRKKRVPAHIVSFDDEDFSQNSGSTANVAACSSAPPTCLSTPTELLSFRCLAKHDMIEGGHGLESACTDYKDITVSMASKADEVIANNVCNANYNSDVDNSSSCDDFKSPDGTNLSERECEPKKDSREFEAVNLLSSVAQLSNQKEVEVLCARDANESSCGPVSLGGFACVDEICTNSSGSEEDESKGNEIGVTPSLPPSSSSTSILNPSRLRIPFFSFSSRKQDTRAPLTPVNDLSVGELFPLSHGEEILSEDSVSIPSYSEDDACATTQRHSLLEHSSNYSTAIQNHVLVKASKIHTLADDELRQALITIMEKKDELEEQNRSLRHLMEKEVELSSALRIESEEQTKRHQEKLEKMQTKLQTLSRENGLLKHQLKKYVGAVQMLKRDGTQAHEVLVKLNRDGQLGGPDGQPYIDYHLEATEYEKKLIQVAEMHGELMEFNERLHHLLSQKEFVIRRLKEELVDLRGPLPDDAMTSDDDISITSDYDTSSMTAATRALINVWIPSVFLTGKASDVHHVYQVYIRIRDDEWNIYRRYAQFYALHKDLKKKDSAVNAFEFPPKKVLGNKDAKFVEERRKRLQHYLRCIMNLILQSNADLATNPDKETLTSLLPFFGEFASNASRRRSVQRRGQGIFSRSTSNPINSRPSGHYTGL